MKPLVVDFYCGLGGWAEAFLAEGYDVIGFHNERHDYGTGGYPGQLVLQDVCTIHGAQFVPLLDRLAVFVASSPCQEFSYRAMPWKRARALGPPLLGTKLFWQSFRIQHELYEASGVEIPLIAENVRGAEKWIGSARWHFGSYYLWGDVPALMPITMGGVMKPGVAHGSNGETNFHGTAQRAGVKVASDTGRRTDVGKGARLTTRDCGAESKGMRLGRGSDYGGPFDPRRFKGGSSARKAASAEIAKIPFPLAQHIARVFKPHRAETPIRHETEKATK